MRIYRYEPVVGIKTAMVEVYMHEQEAPPGDLPRGWKATRAEATEAAVAQMKDLANALLRKSYELQMVTTRWQGA